MAQQDDDDDDQVSEYLIEDRHVDARWVTALPDWKDRILGRQSLIPALPLDNRRADRALRLFKQLRMPDVTGTPTYGEACDQSIFDLVRAIFGAFDAKTARRMIREYFLLIPKKNGKTSIGGAIMLVAMMTNERPEAELALIAPTIKIAKRSFKQALGIIRITVLQSGVELADLFSVHPSDRQIKFLSEAVPSELVIMAADTDVVTGSKASYVLIDETHEFAAKNKAGDVFIELRGGLSHESNTGFLMQITTQSKNPPAGVFKAELDMARAVRDGQRQYPMLAVLYELPPEVAKDDGWKDQRLWPLVNPQMGRSVSLRFLQDEVSKAEAGGKEALAKIASQHFNVQIGLSMHGDRWAGADYWEGSKRADLTEDVIIAECDVVTVGIDGGGLDDLMALAVIGRHRKTRKWMIWVRAWAQSDVFERRKEIAARLQDFIAQGDLIKCNEVAQDATEIAAICAKIHAAGLFPEKGGIGLDPYGVAAVTDALAEAGIPDDVLAGIGQGYKLQPAIQTLPRRLKDKTAIHADQPIMDWAVGNAKAELRGSNIMVTKQAAGSAKIDPLMALFNATILMLANPEAAGQSEGSYIDQAEVLVF